MSRIAAILALFLAVATLGTASAAQARSYADALQKAGSDKPVVLFCYGANFDNYNERIYTEYIKKNHKAIRKVIGREIFAVVPVYQLPTEAEKKIQNKALGGRGLPSGIWSYPCFIIVDGKGQFRAAVQSQEELADPEKTAEALAKVLEGFKAQQKLLEKSAKAKGNKKAELMREALAIGNVKVPGHGLCDPSQNGLVEKLQVMDLVYANTFIRHYILHGNFTRYERQMIMAAYAGHVRRSKGPIHRLEAIYTEMRNIDPTTIYGAYAEGALELWVEPHKKEASQQSGQPAAAPSAE